MTKGLESLGRVNTQGIALVVVAFLVGGLAGVAGERLWMAQHAPGPPVPFPGRSPRFFEQLDLSPQQQDRINAIFEESQPLTDSVLQESMPRLRFVYDSIQQEIRTVLTPEQRERLDQLQPKPRPGRFGPGGRPGMRRMRPDTPPPPPG